MIARYRLVWFVPDPFSGGRVPLGALVERSGAVSFVPVGAPGQSGLTPAQGALARLVVAELAHADSFDTLPPGVGPQIIAGAALSVPVAVTEPNAWIAQRVLGAAAA